MYRAKKGVTTPTRTGQLCTPYVAAVVVCSEQPAYGRAGRKSELRAQHAEEGMVDHPVLRVSGTELGLVPALPYDGRSMQPALSLLRPRLKFFLGSGAGVARNCWLSQHVPPGRPTRLKSPISGPGKPGWHGDSCSR